MIKRHCFSSNECFAEKFVNIEYSDSPFSMRNSGRYNQQLLLWVMWIKMVHCIGEYDVVISVDVTINVYFGRDTICIISNAIVNICAHKGVWVWLRTHAYTSLADLSFGHVGRMLRMRMEIAAHTFIMSYVRLYLFTTYSVRISVYTCLSLRCTRDGESHLISYKIVLRIHHLLWWFVYTGLLTKLKKQLIFVFFGVDTLRTTKL